MVFCLLSHCVQQNKSDHLRSLSLSRSSFRYATQGDAMRKEQMMQSLLVGCETLYSYYGGNALPRLGLPKYQLYGPDVLCN